MGIINTLDKCLDSPFLFRDADAPRRVPGLLDQAEDQLGAARDLLGGAKPDPTDVGILAHAAMFAAIRALVYARGYREAGMKCLILACERFYVRDGHLDAAQLLAYERVQGYKLGPAESVAAAAELVDRARALLGPPGAPVSPG